MAKTIVKKNIMLCNYNRNKKALDKFSDMFTNGIVYGGQKLNKILHSLGVDFTRFSFIHLEPMTEKIFFKTYNIDLNKYDYLFFSYNVAVYTDNTYYYLKLAKIYKKDNGNLTVCTGKHDMGWGLQFDKKKEIQSKLKSGDVYLLVCPKGTLKDYIRIDDNDNFVYNYVHSVSDERVRYATIVNNVIQITTVSETDSYYNNYSYYLPTNIYFTNGKSFQNNNSGFCISRNHNDLDEFLKVDEHGTFCPIDKSGYFAYRYRQELYGRLEEYKQKNLHKKLRNSDEYKEIMSYKDKVFNIDKLDIKNRMSIRDLIEYYDYMKVIFRKLDFVASELDSIEKGNYSYLQSTDRLGYELSEIEDIYNDFTDFLQENYQVEV